MYLSGMQTASELKGSFLGANTLCKMLRYNPITQLWRNIVSSITELVQKHLFSFGVHSRGPSREKFSKLILLRACSATSNLLNWNELSCNKSYPNKKLSQSISIHINPLEIRLTEQA
jgi:hypothetical protein